MAYAFNEDKSKADVYDKTEVYNKNEVYNKSKVKTKTGSVSVGSGGSSRVKLSLNDLDINDISKLLVLSFVQKRTLSGVFSETYYDNVIIDNSGFIVCNSYGIDFNTNELILEVVNPQSSTLEIPYKLVYMEL